MRYPSTSAASLISLAASFELSLEERELSERTVGAYQRTLTQFTAYLAEHKLPMPRVQAPKVTTKIKPTPTDADLAKLLKAAEDTTFEARCDTAILRVLIDSGVRVSGLGSMLLEDVSLRNKTIKVALKDGNEHLIPLGRKAVAAVDRYIRGQGTAPARRVPVAVTRHQRHDWLNSGGSEADGMRIAGWKTRAMIEHYTGELAVERARQAHALLAPGDRL